MMSHNYVSIYSPSRAKRIRKKRWKGCDDNTKNTDWSQCAALSLIIILAVLFPNFRDQTHKLIQHISIRHTLPKNLSNRLIISRIYRAENTVRKISPVHHIHTLPHYSPSIYYNENNNHNKINTDAYRFVRSFSFGCALRCAYVWILFIYKFIFQPNHINCLQIMMIIDAYTMLTVACVFHAVFFSLLIWFLCLLLMLLPVAAGVFPNSALFCSLPNRFGQNLAIMMTIRT